MAKNEKEHMIEWLCIWTNYSRSYWENQSIEHIEMNYNQFIDDNAV